MTENLSDLEKEVQAARATLSKHLDALSSTHMYESLKVGLSSTARSSTQTFLEELTARAAANPIAAFAISAGVAWRLIKHPPIASALIGAGAYGLWRTHADKIEDGQFWPAARQRLGEQVEDAVTSATQLAVKTADLGQEKAKEFVDTAGQKIHEMASSAADTANEGWEVAKDQALSLSQNGRDQLMLGVAGVAVAAALGMVLQRRFSDQD